MSDQAVTVAAAAERWPADKPFPAVMYDAELIAVLGRGPTTYHRLKAAGAFKAFELRPQLPGSNTQYSGRLIERWVRGEFDESRFFASARRRPPAPDGEKRRPGRPRKSRPVPVQPGIEE